MTYFDLLALTILAIAIPFVPIMMFIFGREK